MEGKKVRKQKVTKFIQIMVSRINNTQNVFCVHFLYWQVCATICNNIAQVLGGVLTRDGVEKDEVFKVGYLAALPALGHVGCLE